MQCLGSFFSVPFVYLAPGSFLEIRVGAGKTSCRDYGPQKDFLFIFSSSSNTKHRLRTLPGFGTRNVTDRERRNFLRGKSTFTNIDVFRVANLVTAVHDHGFGTFGLPDIPDNYLLGGTRSHVWGPWRYSRGEIRVQTALFYNLNAHSFSTRLTWETSIMHRSQGPIGPVRYRETYR